MSFIALCSLMFCLLIGQNHLLNKNFNVKNDHLIFNTKVDSILNSSNLFYKKKRMGFFVSLSSGFVYNCKTKQ